MADDQKTADPGINRIAIKWLMYQHGMTVEQASETMTGLCADRSRMSAIRQEALDVAYFLTDIIEIEVAGGP